MLTRSWSYQNHFRPKAKAEQKPTIIYRTVQPERTKAFWVGIVFWALTVAALAAPFAIMARGVIHSTKEREAFQRGYHEGKADGTAEALTRCSAAPE